MPGIPKTFIWAGCFLLFAIGSLRALDEPSSYVLDLPFAANQATPLWLGHPDTPPSSTFATLNLPITPPDSAASLLVTVFFQEKDGGFLRISWQSTQGGSQMLSTNFYEGIGMSNQRSLLIPASTLLGDGTLSFLCGDSNLGIQRIKLEWLENKTGLVSPQVQDLLVTSENGATQPSQKLDGQPKPADDPAWHGKVVVVPITDAPQRVEQGVQFDVQLDALPATARLTLKEAGLPWGKRLVVWVNDQRAGTIAPEVPDLLDEGYLLDSPKAYVGWRTGSFYVPVSLLKTSDNTVQFSIEDEEIPTPVAGAAPYPADTTTAPLAIKDAILQFFYPPPSPVATTPSTPTQDNSSAQPQTDTAPSAVPSPATPTAPASTDSSSSTPTAPATP